jgi:mannose-1-phosphate guanylyltransferase
MVLAAGFGTRLRPLTDLLPKPLVPVANQPLIHYTLSLLKKAGITRVAINLHHLGDRIVGALGKDGGLGLSILYSDEKEILGTGGGVARLRPFLDNETFLLVNADILTAVSLEKVLKFHREKRAVATLVVRPLPPGQSFTSLFVDEQGWLASFKEPSQPRRGPLRTCMFEGIHVLEPAIFDFLPREGFSGIIEQGYAGMLSKGLPVAAYVDSDPWFDLGTPASYLLANREVLSGRAVFPQVPLDPLLNGVLLGQGVSIGSDVRLGPEVAVGENCILRDGAALARSVLWPGSEIKLDEHLQGVIIAGKHRIQT